MGEEDWALSVGIGHYGAEKRLPALPGARRDAQRFHAWVRSARGGNVPEDKSTLLQSPDPQDPRKLTPLAHEIEDWFMRLHLLGLEREEAQKGFRIGRRLYVFVAGHGYALGQQREAALLPANAIPPDISDGFPARLWADWFRDAGAFDEVVLFMDCCRSESRNAPVRPPPYGPRNATHEPARYLYGFAALNGRNAREIVVNKQPAGLFTHSLLQQLEDMSLRPLSASVLSGRLYGTEQLQGEFTPQIMLSPNPKDDFVLLPDLGKPAPEDGGQAAGGSILVYDGNQDDAVKLATAVRLAGGATVAFDDSASLSSGDFRQMLVAGDGLAATKLQEMVATVKPQSVVTYTHDQALPDLPVPADIVRAHESDSAALARLRVLAMVTGRPRADLRVVAADPWTILSVWTETGELIAEGRDDLFLEQVPHGKYRIMARVGASSVTREGTVPDDNVVRLPPVPLITPAPLDGNAAWSEDERQWLAALDRNARLVVVRRGGPDLPSPPGGDGGASSAHGSWRATTYDVPPPVATVPIGELAVALAVPTPPGHRTEVFVAGGDVSIRIVPAGLAVGAAMPTDRVRETLRAWFAHDGRYEGWVEPQALEGDAIAALLAASTWSAPIPPDVEFWWRLIGIARGVLGDDAEDLRVWQAGAVLTRPPLFAQYWGRAEVEAGSIADDVAGREISLGPWLAWDTSKEPWRSSWLRTLASIMWPGWDRDLGPAIAPPATKSLAEAAATLRAPPSSVRRRTYKSPPIDALTKRQSIAFVGATNDQLPAALAVAFIERGQRKWGELSIWSLDDEKLGLVRSDDRTGDPLRAARDRAESELLRLLPLVAERWRLLRYDGFATAGAWHFASLWDWTRPGEGYVHVSRYTAGEELRTAAASNATWAEGAAAPPAEYAAAVDAFGLLQPTRIVRES